jgi:thiol-disulfide isomerase/thioredoxin
MNRAGQHFTTFRAARWLVMAAWLGVALASAAEPRPFSVKSLEEIRWANQGRPFLLAFWSVNCEPCKEELSVIAALHRKFPNVPVVLVAADPPGLKPAVVRLLAGYELGRIETWQFAEDFAEKIRHAVDRAWRGELPRTYFFDAAHAKTAHSGLLDRREAESWFERAATRARQ